MFIADHAPVYPRVKLTRYDKLTALQQAAVFCTKIAASIFSKPFQVCWQVLREMPCNSMTAPH